MQVQGFLATAFEAVFAEAGIMHVTLHSLNCAPSNYNITHSLSHTNTHVTRKSLSYSPSHTTITH
eukprot:1381735-Amorphochlora_amoeboformis.AAC.2